MMSPTIEKYKDGALVFRQGQRGDRMYIVMSGAIRIFREDRGVETTLAQLGFGETFGELATRNCGSSRTRSSWSSTVTGSSGRCS
jgi:CRP/FNR family cyclic AMP-dependent transcriptional regulator